jgi:hypothetical protein
MNLLKSLEFFVVKQSSEIEVVAVSQIQIT